MGLFEEITVVKPKPVHLIGFKMERCQLCGHRPVAWLAKDEFGDFLYPVFCSNKDCRNSYSPALRQWPMRTPDEWNHEMVSPPWWFVQLLKRLL